MHEIRKFLEMAASHLACPVRTELECGTDGHVQPHNRANSSTFILSDWLETDAQYSSGELPRSEDLLESYVRDAAWAGQGPIAYEKVAHIVLPRFFTEEYIYHNDSDYSAASIPIYTMWKHEQNLDDLAVALAKSDIAFAFTGNFLEIKRF